jgi:putative addiction module CopG family antidote
MQIELTPEQEFFVKDAIATGRFKDASEAVHCALSHWVESERKRLQLIAAIEEGERSLEEDGGSVLETEQDIRNFFNDVEARGRTRLATTQSADLCA